MIITYHNPKTNVKITFEGSAEEMLPIVANLIGTTTSDTTPSVISTSTTKRNQNAKTKPSPRAKVKASPAVKTSSSSNPTGDLRAIFESLQLPDNLR